MLKIKSPTRRVYAIRRLCRRGVPARISRRALDFQGPARTGSPQAGAARRRGEEYLLERKLFRRKSTGEIVAPVWIQLSFPTRWHYDVLRALEYFRCAGREPDPRMNEALDVLRSKQQPDGTWLLENTHPGKTHFALEEGDGRPSRWNTLRALRVLRWYEQPR